MDTYVQQLIESNGIASVRLVSPSAGGRSHVTPVAADTFLRALRAGEDLPDEVAAIVRSADLSTLAIIPWEPDTATCVCDLCPLPEDPTTPSPRAVLRRILNRYRDAGYTPQGWASLLLSCRLGSEPARPGRLVLHAIQHEISDDQLVERMVELMRVYGVQVDGYQRARDHGSFEVALSPSPLMEVADQAALFGVGAGDIFRLLSLPPPFPPAGRASGRVYLSLLASDGEQNLFRRGIHDDAPGPVLRYFLAGIADSLPDLLALLAPPLPGARWEESPPGGQAPRPGSAGISLFHPARRSSAVEIRLPALGPRLYLAFAVLLAGGLYGIERRLDAPSHLDARDFAAFLLADEQQELALPTLPGSLPAALDRWRRSRPVSDYLGEDVVASVLASQLGVLSVD